jgi:hypothetical protein
MSTFTPRAHGAGMRPGTSSGPSHAPAPTPNDKDRYHARVLGHPAALSKFYCSETAVAGVGLGGVLVDRSWPGPRILQCYVPGAALAFGHVPISAIIGQ